jgi:hypothetical protein
VPQADKVIDQVAALYPTNPWPKWVRFLILAMTDRPRAARAVLAASPGLLGGSDDLAVWKASLTALEERSPLAIGKAREACFQAAHKAGGFAVDTVMILAALGQVDAAFDIANGLLLSRGSVVATRTSGGSIAVKSKTEAAEDVNDATWRINTQYLFTPPCAILRADPRFLALCEGMGLTDYWHARGVRPDYQLAAG